MVKSVESSSSKKTPNPVFNEAFVFHIPLERVQDTELVMTLGLEDDPGTIYGKVRYQFIEFGDNLCLKP